MAMISLKGSINEINNEKVFAVAQDSESTSNTVDLSAVQMPLAPTGQYVCRTTGINQPMLVLEGTEDFWYAFGTADDGEVTDAAGDFPGIFVKANDQEYVRPAAQVGRFYLYVIRDSADGIVVVSVCKTSASN